MTPARRLADHLPPALLEPDARADDRPSLLAALLAAADEQVRLLAEDVDAVWDDLFIESCADWAVPYIGDLLGLPADASRQEVGHAMSLRRRKGTPAALEEFARALTGWHVRVVEGWQVSARTHRLGDPAIRAAALAPRAGRAARLGTPFERAMRSTAPGRRWAPAAASVIVFPWRLRTSHAPARPLGENRWGLHPVAGDAPLYVRPRTGAGGEPELAAPVPATYDLLDRAGDALAAADADPEPPLISLWAGREPVQWTALRFGPVPAPVAPEPRTAVVDPLRGRVELGAGLDGPLRAAIHRPVSGQLGALAAPARAELAASVVVSVVPGEPETDTRASTLEGAIALAERRSASAAPAAAGSPDVEIRLETVDRLPVAEPIVLRPRLPRWRIVAPSLVTPIVTGDLVLDLEGASVELTGFCLEATLSLGPGLGRVALDGITMNPTATEACLRVDAAAWELELEARRSILCPIRAGLTARAIRLAHCVVDARGHPLARGGSRPPRAGAAGRAAVDRDAGIPPAIEAVGVTFAGRVRADRLEAAHCLFLDDLEVIRRDSGWLSDCYVVPVDAAGSRPVSRRCTFGPAPALLSTGFESGGYYAPDLRSSPAIAETGAYRHARRHAALRRLHARIHEFVPLGLRPHVELAPWEEP